MTKPTEHTRVLDVEGAYNVRDLGGYVTRDGRRPAGEDTSGQTPWRT